MRHRVEGRRGRFCTRRGSGHGERDEDAEADREESNRVDVVSVSLVVISKRRSSFPWLLSGYRSRFSVSISSLSALCDANIILFLHFFLEEKIVFLTNDDTNASDDDDIRATSVVMLGDSIEDATPLLDVATSIEDAVYSQFPSSLYKTKNSISWWQTYSETNFCAQSPRRDDPSDRFNPNDGRRVHDGCDE